ncbi:hypothetical protein Emed_000144 [Eimeria media]
MEAKSEQQEHGGSQQSQEPVTAVTSSSAEASTPASVDAGSASQTAPKPADAATVFAVKSETPAAEEKGDVTSAASSVVQSQTQTKTDENNPATEGASAAPSQVKGGGGAPPAAASQGAPPGSQLVLLDGKEVGVKLERLFDCWGGKGPNAATAVWGDVDALCVFVGRAADEDDSAAERMQSWLTGFQFLETLFVFVRATKAWLVLTSAKKADHLRQLSSIKGLQIFVKEPQGSNQRTLEQISAVLKSAVGKEAERDIRVASFLGGSLAETPGTMAAEALVADASRVSVAMVKHQLVSRVEFVLDNGQKESHKSICDRAELLLKDQKQLQKLKEKYNLDPAEVEVLFKNVQSGSRFDLRASAQPTADPLSQTEGTIVVSLGCKYKDFCGALCRTFILNGRKEHKSTYELALELQQHLIASLKPGVSFSSIHEKAIEFLNAKRPALLKHLAKNVGHAIGAQYRDARLVFNQKNDKVFTEAGMTFLVSVGFSELRTSNGNDYAVWIADTVHLKPDGSVQVLTDGLSSQLAYVNYELDDGEEEQKPSPPAKAKSSKDEKRENKKGGDENADGNAADKKKGKDKRFAREDADDAGDEQQQRRQKKMQDIRAFNSPDEFPKDLRPSKV